jgi:cytochrome b6-f complex iron-sulfur subunit
MNMNRRSFIVAAACTCACSLASPALCDSEPQVIEIGTPADYPKDGVYDKYLKTNRILILRGGGKIVAASALCTHRSCTLKLVEQEIYCPCHGSRFSPQGAVVKGPATQGLKRYAITLVEGKLKVDPSKTFTEKQSDDPLSFYKVPQSKPAAP